MKKIYLSIVEDHEMFSDTLSKSLSNEKGIEIVFKAVNGKDFFNQLALSNKKPNIILLDIEMPEMDGISTTKKIRKELPEAKIIIITAHNKESFIYSFVKLGVDGYIFKSAPFSEIINALEKIKNGEEYYNPKYIRVMKQALKRTKKPNSIYPTPFAELTLRELDVLHHICDGKYNSETGEILGISERTVETHRKSIMKKLNCHNTAKLVSVAIRNKLVDLG